MTKGKFPLVSSSPNFCLSDQCSRLLWYLCWRPSATYCGPRWRCQSITVRTGRQLCFGEIQSEILVARALEKLADANVQGCQEAGCAHNSRRRQRQQKMGAADIQHRTERASHRRGVQVALEERPEEEDCKCCAVATVAQWVATAERLQLHCLVFVGSALLVVEGHKVVVVRLLRLC